MTDSDGDDDGGGVAADRFERFLRRTFRRAGRQYAEATRAYREGRDGARAFDLPTDEQGRARLVCRRHADRRAVRVDADAHPACFEPGHPDCEGCAEDVREGVVETW